ncbi:Putative protein of unknown function [Podospora comata]|uniref:Uncharacterized protein n=1 Tax=Podospora comata TaxID=48703 RepID=A0ABY6RXK9_PODCO|nr:Putative protein of unknown function [Podospora comata]
MPRPPRLILHSRLKYSTLGSIICCGYRNGRRRSLRYPSVPASGQHVGKIVANAQEFPYFAVVGSGNNGRLRPFTIRKDNQGVLYRDGQGYDCRAIYVAV